MVSHIHRPPAGELSFSRSSWFLALAVALTCFSYPLTTIVLKMAGTNVSFFNLIIKAVTATLFVLVFLARRNSFMVSPSISAPLLIFLVIYACRLIYDIMYLDVRQGWSSPFYTMSYFFLLTFVPVFVMALAIKKEDIVRIATTSFWTLALACLTVAAYILIGGEIDSSTVFSGRVQIDGDIEGTALLGPIHIGLVGASLAGLCLGKMAFVQNQSIQARLLNLAFVVLGIVNLLVAGSRGPLLGLVVALVFLMTAYALPRMGTSKLSAITGTMLFIGPLALIYFISIADLDSIYLFERVSVFLEERASGAKEERDFIYQAAWLDFLDHPIFGRSMVVSTTGFGAHNLPLEVLMSTGVVGGSFFAVATVVLLATFSRILRGAAGPEAACMLLAAAPIFVLSLTSGSIAEGPSLWVLYGMFTVIGARFCFVRKSRTTQNESSSHFAMSASPIRQQHPNRMGS
jgi:O-antigen ligase